ncbi:HIRAN domain-containing protein [Plantactinospora sonchi]|uniref:HIRAN domain-containing protein n=1 Tax=Plantactinospora sonchi TaxID=1544735 RepID=A0ABU7RWS9_9ACTN
MEIVGESHYYPHIRRLLGTGALTRDSREVMTVAQLVPEPRNRFDPNAIGVYVGGGQVGHLPREQAVRYSPVLLRLVDEGWTPQVAARVYGYEHDDWEDESLNPRQVFVGSVRVALAEPHMVVPATLPPSERHAVLPTGRKVQVTGEEKHINDLVPLLGQHGETWVHATLHELVEQKARSSRTVAEVRINGSAVGTLTPATSGDLLPVIRHLAGRDVVTTARAILKGNRVKADLVLDVCRMNELSDAWLDSPPLFEGTQAVGGSRGETVVPATATAWRFNPAPGWPPCPPGWTPPAGWRPDPSWPAAPVSWQFWVAS